MKHLILFFGSLIAVMNANAQTCDPTPEKHAIRIQAVQASGNINPLELPTVSGDKSFYQKLENGWVFALIKTELGWSVRLYDGEPVGDATDLTSLTPPLRGAPNPRDIAGWHFRNADNTGPNQGDVNAPQNMRAFIISPSLAGTAGLRSSGGPQTPGPDAGIGWLNVVDFGLANPVPGTKARMNYLQFDACLSWPRSGDETSRLIDEASLEFLPEELETFGSCGLTLRNHALSAAFAPRQLGGDIDGDGALDEVAQILRGSDERRGLALCRAGTWLHLIDFEDGDVPGLRPGFVGQTEAWQWVSQDDPLPRHLVGYDMPEADGDYLILERVEKEAVVVYWRNETLAAKRMYGHVEP